MWFTASSFRMWHNLSLGGAIRGKWIIPDGMVIVVCFHIWSSEGGIPRLCAGEDLPPLSGDADEGCQWEVQTNKGWVPY
jgi:hypothetical protein